MRIPRPAREYERTCADCGQSWRVPRQFARKGIVSILGATSGQHVLRPRTDPAASGPVAADLEAGYKLAEEAAALRECPRCSSVRYSQRPARS
jgi:hypothetical protein